MGNPFGRFGMSDSDFERAIAEAAEVDAGLNEFMNREVVPYWRSQAPVDSGAYAASIKVVQKGRRGKGKVRATDFKAAWIEFGTGEPGKTDAYAPGQRTASHFGGTLDDGIGGQE
jgi:hypothetical protein